MSTPLQPTAHSVDGKHFSAGGMEQEREKYGDKQELHSSAEAYDDVELSTDAAEEDANDTSSPIEKVKSKASVNNVASVPNGGLQAWAQVVGAFFLFMNTWGILNTFGVYQTYYESDELFHSSSSNISWIGSIQSFLLLLVGALTGPVYDAGHFRILIGTGSFLVVLGQMMLSLCHEYWQVLLAQAFCVGIGSGMLFVPSVAIMSTYFTTKIAFAIGLAASGSSLGGVIYPIVFHNLQPSIGFGWATRVLGFLSLFGLIISNLVMRVRVLPAQKRKLIDWAAFKEPDYVTFAVGASLGSMGLYIPFFYIQYYSIVTNVTSPQLGFYLLAILNGASIFGRIVRNFIADKVGPINLLVPSSLLTGILTLCLIGIHHVAGVVIFCILYGFFSGTFVSLPPAAFVTLSPNRGMIGTRMGMGYCIVSIGTLIGSPIAGQILGSDNYFNGAWIFGGVLPIAGGFCFLFARMWKAKWKLVAKV